MQLKSVYIENFRAIRKPMLLPLHPQLNVLVAENANGKTTVLEAIATGLGIIPGYFSVKGRGSSLEDIAQTQRADFMLSEGQVDEDFAPYMRVKLETTDAIRWDVSRYHPQRKTASLPAAIGHKQLREFLAAYDDAEPDKMLSLPVLAYYATNRALLSSATQNNSKRQRAGRFAALDNSLKGASRFSEFMQWFATQEDLERREKEKLEDFTYRSPRLEIVRGAVEKMLPGCRNLHTQPDPLQLFIDYQHPEGLAERLSLAQLSDGYRTTLALVADLARRMAIANPHLDDPLHSPAIVLIDEVDLHLHPKWQQQIIALDASQASDAALLPEQVVGLFQTASLLTVFPKTQFIVSTHSDELLTSVQPENIIALFQADGSIQAEPVDHATYGAKSGRLLERVLGAQERPPHNLFTRLLYRYHALLETDKWDTDEAKQILQRLEALSANEPALASVRMEIRRRQVMRERKTDNA